MTSIVRIDARFNGPPDSANGGYATGLFAGATGESVKVRLLRPVPMQRDLVLSQTTEERWDVLDGADVIATATLAAMNAEVESHIPPAVPYIEALRASKDFAGFTRHAFPTCFVCGPARHPGDGLRIFAGPAPGTDVVAAPWLPDRSLDDGRGKVRPEFIWAALDCPGYWASASAAPALLGELAVHIDRPVHVEESCVIVGWRISVDGRKHRVGTALFDEDGERCAVGVATWITLQSAGSGS